MKTMFPKSHFIIYIQLFTFLILLPTKLGSYELDDPFTYNDEESPAENIMFAHNKFASVFPNNELNNVISVDDFGAKADGNDDSQAFKDAWVKVCNASTPSYLFVPQNKTYMIKPVRFEGPCKSNLTVLIKGMIKASSNESDFSSDSTHWITFENIKHLTLTGGGVINGNGQTWWQTSCKRNKTLPCRAAPTAVSFRHCNQLVVSKMWFQDAQQMHVIFAKCTNVTANNLLVSAPSTSPNTDGIHITHTRNMRLTNSLIKTGDDCVSIVSGSKNIQVDHIVCGPGHGISIGSLGGGNSEAHVSDVLVSDSTLRGTTNGVRIKTWQGGSGFAQKITFQNIIMDNVTNPIVIDQNYCDKPDKSCSEENSAVKVSDVLYKNIIGTSAKGLAIKFNCSVSVPCENIVMEDVNLKLANANDSGAAKASCSNIVLGTKGRINPICSFK